VSKFRSYPRPKPLTPEDQAWFEMLIRLQANTEPVQLEMKLDTGCTEFGNGFDDESEEMPMETRVIHEPV
jgi:hypothetical protein